MGRTKARAGLWPGRPQFADGWQGLRNGMRLRELTFSPPIAPVGLYRASGAFGDWWW